MDINRSIIHELVACEAKVAFYKDIHDVAIGMLTLHDDVFDAVQRDKKLILRQNTDIT
jgi:hypothetical protein